MLTVDIHTKMTVSKLKDIFDVILKKIQYYEKETSLHCSQALRHVREDFALGIEQKELQCFGGTYHGQLVVKMIIMLCSFHPFCVVLLSWDCFLQDILVLLEVLWLNIQYSSVCLGLQGDILNLQTKNIP